MIHRCDEMKLVIKIGGSVIASPPNSKLINRYAELLRSLKDQGYEFIVVVGGGSPAREFIKLAEKIGLNEGEQDEVAISVSRLFAQLLSLKIGGPKWKNVPTSIVEAVRKLEKNGMAVMGGLKPGMTTDTVAALIASRIKADLIVKATDQDGIYTKDPRKHPDAEKIGELSFDQLFQLLHEPKHKAGIHQILDPEAVRILRKEKIKTIVLNGFKPENIFVAIRDEKIGTRIQ